MYAVQLTWHHQRTSTAASADLVSALPESNHFDLFPFSEAGGLKVIVMPRLLEQVPRYRRTGMG